MREWKKGPAASDGPSSPSGGATPGRRTLIESLPVQRRTSRPAKDDEQVVEQAADHATSGPGEALPHADAIQRSFGKHDVSGIRAHTDPAAAEGSRAMNAQAFARGSDVAFDGAPSLHTAAHEAAHVVQQRAGISFSRGVGAEGDEHERHADAVADLVVQGRSAETLLDRYAESSTAGGRAVQRLPTRGQLNARVGNQNDPTLNMIRALLDQFHDTSAPLIGTPFTPLQTRRQQFSDARMQILDQLEHLIYAWLDANPQAAPAGVAAPNLGQVGGGHNVFATLLDEVQVAHRQHVDYMHQHNLTLWTPDRATLGAPAAAALDADWNALRNNAGQIHMTDTSPAPGPGAAPHQHPAFMSEMRAMHARLLSRPQGRALLHQLLQGAGALNGAGGAAAHQLEIMPYHPMHVAMGITGAEANALNPNAALAQVGPAAGGGAYVGPSGQNSGTVMGIEAGLTDTGVTNEDQNHARLAAPAFVLYAHELVHALHNMQGDNRRNVTPGLFAAGQVHAGWDSEEERFAIAGGGITENTIRAEHGLNRARHWHT